MRASPTSLRLLRWATLLALAGCVEPYMPDVASPSASYLVVDGFINGNGVTRIKLSRTASLTSSSIMVEKGATVSIQDSQGGRYKLTEKPAGSYQSDSLLLDPNRLYQLRFATSAGVNYNSDLTALMVTPSIDRLSARRDGNQVLLLLDTHGTGSQPRYYRWQFTETWEFHSAFESKIEYFPAYQTFLGRLVPIYTCWRTEQAGTIRQGTTANLAQNALIEFPALILSAKNERFTIRYSALVSQHAETAAEYAYYELLRKNTEAVGTLNDPLPVQLTGNVHRVGQANEPVLGYVGVHTVQQKRLFIAKQDLNFPSGWGFESAYPTCQMSVYPNAYYNPAILAIDFHYDPNGPTSPNGTPDFYDGAPAECVDCRLRGSATPPGFW